MLPSFHVLIRRLMRLLLGPADPYLDPLAPWEIRQGELVRGLVGALIVGLFLMSLSAALRLVSGIS